MKRNLPLIFLLSLFATLSFAQNPVYFVSGNYANPNTWTPAGAAGAMAPTGFGSIYQLSTTANGTGLQYFRFNSAAAASGLWYGPSAASVTVGSNTSTTSSSGNTTYAYALNVGAVTDNIIFNTGAGAPGTAKFVAFMVTGTVRTVASVSQSPTAGAINPGQPVTVTATLSGAFAGGQSVYLRYSKDAWATSTVVQMTGAATTYTANIPAATNTASANVVYYVFTSNGVVGSGTGPLANGTDADLFTINANNNGGANYSYSVNATGTWYWVGGSSGALTSSSSTVLSSTLGGAPATVTLTTTDKIIFDGSDISSTAGLQTGSISLTNTTGSLSFGQLVLQNTADVTYDPSSTYDITLNGGTGTDLSVAAGSQFSFGATSSPKMILLSGTTGSISGTINMGTGSNKTYQLTGADAGAINFLSGAVCKVNVSSATYPFGNGTNGSVIFASGSKLAHTRSDEIFGGTGKTIVVFQTGSTYEYVGVNSTSFNFRLGSTTDRVYADVIINTDPTSTNFNTGGYTNNPTVDNFTVASTASFTSGTRFDMQDFSHTLTIKGNLVNNNTYPLGFSPNANGTATVNFSGSGTQYILNNSGSTGGIIFGKAASSRLVYVNITSGATVKLGNAGIPGDFTLTSLSSFPVNTIFTVKTGGTIDMGTSVMYGETANNGGSFITETGSTIKTGHLSGLSTTAATGSVQTQAKTYHSGANYVYNGTTGAQVTGNFFASTTPSVNAVNSLTIDNSNGVQYSIASGTVTINGTLLLTNGIFNTITNNAIVLVPSGASVTRTNGWVYGSLQKYVSGSTNFETGDNLFYANVTVGGAISVPGLFTVKANANGDHPNIGSSDLDATKSENTYWTLTNNSVGFSSGANLVFNYITADIDVTANALNFGLGNYSAGTWSYPPAITPASNSISVTGITSFGDFEAAEAACGSYGTWKGTAGTDWNNPANWCGGVPTTYTNVVIPNVANQPVISTANAVAKTISIASGASLTMSGSYNLTLSGNSFSNLAGATGFNASASTGALVFSTTATISGTNSFQNVSVSGGGLDFGTASTVYGTFTINPGGYVNNNKPPIYDCNSTLLYNTGGNYTRGDEWKTGVTSGQPGYPGNVQLSNPGTNLNFNSSTASICGNLTIDVGTYFDMGSFAGNALRVAKNVTVNGNLYLSMGFGGDIYVGGNYTVGAAGIVFNNNRATFFNGSSGNQLITKVAGGTIFIDFMIVNKTAGDVKLSNSGSDLTNLQINSSTNNASEYRLQLLGGNVDLNGQTFTLFGTVVNSTNIFTDGTGPRRIYTSSGTGSFVVAGSALAGMQNLNVNRASSTSSLTFDANVTLSTSVGVDFGPSGMTLINSIFQINSGGFCINNSPDYGSSSFLIYNNGSGGFNRNVEWNSNVPGPGYPNNIVVQNNTPVVLDTYAFTAAGLGCTGYLEIKAGSSVTMGGLTKNLSVGTDAVISGTLTLSSAAGGDLNVGGSWTRTGSFIQNNRNVTFNSSLDGTITATGGQEFSFVYLDKQNSSNSLKLADNVSVTDELGLTRGTLDLGSNNKFLIIVSTATKTARVAPIANVADVDFNYGASDQQGQFIIQRYVPARRSWRLVAAPIKPAAGMHTVSEAWQERGSPLTGLDYTSANWGASVSADTIAAGFGTQITGGAAADGFDQSPNNNPSIKYYNAGAWPGPANINASSVNSQEGWMLFLRGDRKNYGEITNQYKTPTTTTLRPRGQLFTGSKSITSTGLTVVGNPYASAIDFNTVVRTGAGWPAQPTYYVWDPYLGGAYGTGAFVTLTWNGVDFTRTSPYGAGTFDNRYIPSGAAILVDFPAGGTLTFNETDKSTNNTTLAFRPAVNQMMTVLNTVNPDNTTYVSDGALSLFGTGFNDDVDVNDAVKLSNFSENFSLERNGKILSIERRGTINASDTIFYNMSKMQRKNYQLQFIMDNIAAPPGTVAFLEDTFLHKKTPVSLVDTSRVDFSVNTGEEAAPGRFRLVFRPSVKYTNLQALLQQDDVAVQWTVNDEYNIHGYTIERSTDNRHFTSMDNRLSKGNSLAPVSYEWIDRSPSPGIYYYRIKSESNNGVILYSEVVSVKILNSRKGMYVFPNPVSDNHIRLQLNGMPAGPYQVQLSNNAGQQVFATIIHHAGGNATHSMQPPFELSNGVYTLTITNHGKQAGVIKLFINQP